MDVRLKEAKEGKRKTFFMDASHLIFGIYLSYIWCFEKIYLPSPSGRERLSVLGAMDAVIPLAGHICAFMSSKNDVNDFQYTLLFKNSYVKMTRKRYMSAVRKQF